VTGTERPRRLDLLWITNIATPYRAPFWDSLGTRLRLGVAVMADSEHNRQWEVDLDGREFEVIHCRARPIYRTDDNTVYAPSLRLLAAVTARPRAIVIDGWESPAYIAAKLWARILGVPVFASYRTSGSHRFTSGPVAAVRGWFLRSSRAVLTAGVASTADVTAMGVPRQRVVEGFNTVDVDRFAEGAARARGRIDRTESGHRFLYVGMLIQRKNVGGLIDAFAEVREPDDTLTIVGTGPLAPELRAQVRALELDEAVHFRGHLDGDALTSAYGEADTFVLSSTVEVWGLVVNEALAAGLHVVVSDTAGVAPNVAGMPCVFLAPPTPQGVARGMAASRESWSGPHTDHPIIAHTPEALASLVVEMVRAPCDLASDSTRAQAASGTQGGR
jgi:glycosyltransferase involved in cell wall biosynthesis